MKKKMKSKLLAILMSLAMAFTMMPMMAQEAYAKGDSPSIVKSGDLDSFAKDAPITTVRLNIEKFTKESATLVSNNNYYKWGTGEGPQKADSIWTPEVTVPKTKDAADIATEGNEFSLPSFSVTLKDAAIMRDDKTKDLKVTFDNVKVFTKSGMDAYTDCFRIVSLSNNNGTRGIDISPASLAKQHFGLQAKVTCQVVGAAADDTLLLVAAEINNTRSGGKFSLIKGAEDNFDYTESMQFLSGIDSESDIYLAESVIVTTVPADTADKNGYTVRFVGNGDSNTRLAAAVSASGASANVWSSAGNNPNAPFHMFCISPFNAPRQFTSSSGEGGKIELWTDGLTHNTDSESNNFRKLAGGTITTPYTYAVPYGKEVTYRMTPKEGYILDKLYVNEIEADPTNTVYKPDSTEVAYYEYHFASDSVNSDQKISVTWKKYAATKAVTTVTINSTTVSAKTLDAAVKKAGGNKDSVTTIVIGKKVKKISKGAFKNYKNAKTLVVKTKKLKKSKVKKSLKGSKITKIKVKVGNKKVNKKYVKKYKKIFTKKNAGKKVKVTL